MALTGINLAQQSTRNSTDVLLHWNVNRGQNEANLDLRIP